MKQVFLSASWLRRKEMREVAEELNQLDGVFVKSDWLYANDCPAGRDRTKHRREMCYQDIRDLRDCDVYVRFTDDLSSDMVPSMLATCARMFENGLAYGLGKQIYVVGGVQMIYDNLPSAVHVKDKEELKRELCPAVVVH